MSYYKNRFKLIANYHFETSLNQFYEYNLVKDSFYEIPTPVLAFCAAGSCGCSCPACVGNSITFGYTIPEREKYSYPSQLQLLLGPGYEVANFGVPRMTALFSGDYPYVNTEAYRKSLEFNPDIVLLKLGTNDSKAVNWDKKELRPGLPENNRFIRGTLFAPAHNPDLSPPKLSRGDGGDKRQRDGQ